MTPWQLAKESESSQQTALFCFLAKARQLGFDLAKKEISYNYHGQGELNRLDGKETIPELRWLHHIPNGGSRGDTAMSRKITGGQMKAEGVKPGVFDLFWPLKRMRYSGLYIEMKKPALAKTKSQGLSEEQIEFGNFAHSNGYSVGVCFDWLQAAANIEAYYIGK